jgi:hypothetical protein
MTTPKELRAISEQGKKDRSKREEEERKEFDRRAREKRIEQAAKDHAEAARRIGNIECDMKWAAQDGRNSIRVGQVYTTVVSSLESVDKIIADHFIKKGFEVDIDTVDGPDIRTEPDYLHYLVVRW